MAKKKPNETLTCKIKKIHGFLDDNQTKVVATIKWGDHPANVNIRKCWIKDGELHVGSGLVLSEEELGALKEILSHDKLPEIELEEEDEDPEPPQPAGKTPVNFGAIFDDAEEVIKRREAGFTTQDGFIVLRKRPGVKLK